jgi:hypothetical protein
MIECYEAGTVPVEIEEVRAWRGAGHVVPLVWVPVDCFDGAKRRMPAVTVETAERLAGSLEDEQTREGLAAALEDCRGYMGVACSECGCHRPIALVTRHGERFCADCE